MNTNIIKNHNQQLGTVVYENQSGYKVNLYSVLDTTSKRQSLLLTIQTPEGELSEPIHLKRSSFFSNKKALLFLLDYEGGFTFDDILEIHQAIQNKLVHAEGKKLTLAEKVSVKEAYLGLCKYIREHASNEPDSEIRVWENCGYIQTAYFDTVISELSWTGYKKREFLLQLKLQGVLINNGNRLDYFKTFDGIKKRYYAFPLPEESSKDWGDAECA